MGSVLGIMISSIYNYFLANRSLTYKVGPYIRHLHTACRSINENNLKMYQTKLDRLKQDEIVYVNI